MDIDYNYCVNIHAEARSKDEPKILKKTLTPIEDNLEPITITSNTYYGWTLKHNI